MTEESEGYSVASFGDEERGPQAQACRWPLEAGKARTHISPRPPKRNGALLTPDCSPVRPT